MALTPQRLVLANVNGLNILHTEEDEFSSVNCRSAIITVTESDIVRWKWTNTERKVSFWILYIQMHFNESIHFCRNSGDVGLGKKASVCG